DDDQRVVGAGGAPHRHGNAGRGLVVRPCDDVDRRIRARRRGAAGFGLVDDRVADERVLVDGGGELRAELAVREVQGGRVHGSEGRGVPERGRAAVAEHDLVAVGEREQLAKTVTYAADQVLHRGLAVRRAEQAGRGGGQRLQLLGSHLRRSGSETSVAGL